MGRRARKETSVRILATARYKHKTVGSEGGKYSPTQERRETGVRNWNTLSKSNLRGNSSHLHPYSSVLKYIAVVMNEMGP